MHRGERSCLQLDDDITPGVVLAAHQEIDAAGMPWEMQLPIYAAVHGFSGTSLVSLAAGSAHGAPTSWPY
jgi:hypothetical protein